MKNQHFEDTLESLATRINDVSNAGKTYFGTIKKLLHELEYTDDKHCYMSRIDNETVFKNSLYLVGVSSEFKYHETYKLEMNSLYIHLLYDIINEFSIRCANTAIIDMFNYVYYRRYICGKKSTRYKLFLNMFYGIVASSKFDLQYTSNSEVTSTLTSKLNEILKIIGIDNILAIDTDIMFVKNIDFVDELRQTFQYFEHTTYTLDYMSQLNSTTSITTKRLRNYLNADRNYNKFKLQFEN